MKFFLSLILSIVFIGASFAQSSTAITMTTAGSPVINTATGTSTVKVADGYKTVTLQVVVTKTSGVVAGTITVQGSNDGVNYVTVPTAATVAGAVTATATDVATQSFIFIINNSPYLYYRFSYTGSGTMNAAMAGYAVVKK